VLVLLAAATVSRARIWRDGETLFADLARTSPWYVAKGQNNLGVSLQGRGRHREAIGHFERALALNPESAEVLNNLGTSLVALGRLQEAEAQLRRAVELAPELAEPRLNLGVALLLEGRLEEAREIARQLEALDPRAAAALRREIARRAG
jgi:Flp pilus assembly protein TadD